MTWGQTEPEEFVTHNGVTVSHAYDDGCSDNPPLENWYEVGGEEFDIRDLDDKVGMNSHESKHEDIVKALIDKGILTEDGVAEVGGSS